MVTILERGSTHILFQNMILKEEYKKFGKEFSIHPAVIKKELQEYKEADYISVPSFFVRDSFTAQGIQEEKLLVNPFGSNKYFSPANKDPQCRKKEIPDCISGNCFYQKGSDLFIPGTESVIHSLRSV